MLDQEHCRRATQQWMNRTKRKKTGNSTHSSTCQWAQVYHPDKYQASHMKDIATENFQRICEAYEILSDPNKRQIYDIYGMEGLNSGLELGPRLNRAEEIKEELERLKRMKEREKMRAHFQSSGTILANMSLPHCLNGDGLFRGMAITSEIQSHLSKRDAITIGGNLAVNGNEGGGAAIALFSHQISEVSSIEFVASAGLRALVGVQTSRWYFIIPLSCNNGHCIVIEGWFIESLKFMDPPTV